MLGKIFGMFSRKKTKPSGKGKDRFIETDEKKEEGIVLQGENEETEPVAGFQQTFGDVTVRTVKTKKKGRCLEAINGQGVKILMELYGNGMAGLPEGSNAYFFGNKLFVVTRWAEMSKKERRKVETAELALGLHPYSCPQVSLKVDKNWGDVIVNLHHCWEALNNEKAPVDEAIFLFADMEDKKYISYRRAVLPPYIQKFLQASNVSSHKTLRFDIFITAMRSSAREELTRTFSDILYDMCWELTEDFYDSARRADLEDITDGIYIEIDSSNKVTKAYQNE